MTPQEKAREYLLKEHISPLNNILHQCDLKTEFQYYKDIENAFIKGAEWKAEQIKKENQELRHQIRLLIDAIDHAYLRLDGTYGDLSYEVSDQVKYVKSMQIKELKGK